MSAWVIHQGSAETILATLPANSVHCIITSPPYWGLRSYLPADHPDKALEMGQEPTPSAFIARLLTVFEAAWRVLHPTGERRDSRRHALAARKGHDHA